MDAELTNRIVREVLEALGQSPGAGAAPSAAVRNATPAATTSTSPRDVAPARGAKVFVTADALRRRVNGAADKRAVELAWNEVLTPNALDMVQQMRLEVRKKEGPGGREAETRTETRRETQAETQAKIGVRTQAAAKGNSETDTDATPDGRAGQSKSTCKCKTGLVVHLPDGKVAGVVESLAREGVDIVEFNKTGCPLRNLAELCEAIASGRVARGVVIARYAAGAMALAGKSKGIRPVQGTRPASAEAALRQFAANLLVIEHAFSTFHEMRTMVRLFAAGASGEPTDKALLEAIARSEGR